MGYVATRPLPWGDETIAPGDPVPEGEPGRDYASLLYLGLIAEEATVLSDDEVRTHLKDARKRITELEALVAAGDGSDAGGDEPVEGPRLVLTDEQRARLVELGLDGEFTLAQLDAALTPEEDVEGTAAEKAAASTAAPDDDADGDDTGDELPDGVTDLGGGWYLLPDGKTKVHGRKQLDAALGA